VSLLLVAMIYTGSKSLQHLTVARFTVFKNISIVVTALGDRLLFRNHITGPMWASFALVTASSVVGGLHDLNFDAAGYAWMLLNCVASAVYGLGMRLAIRRVDFADFDSVYYNNVLALPTMLGLSLLLEDWPHNIPLHLGAGPRGRLLAGVLLSSVAAFAISYGTAWSMRTASPTSYSMVGALNKLPIALSGMLFFPAERRISRGGVASIALALAGGVLYSLAQMRKTAPK
jgi:GDP-mannose transporter